MTHETPLDYTHKQGVFAAQVIRDSSLVIMVLALVCVDGIIIGVWQLIDPYVVTNRNLTDTVCYCSTCNLDPIKFMHKLYLHE